MMLQIEKVKPAGVKDRSYLSERFPTVLTKMSLEPDPANALNITDVTNATAILTIPMRFNILWF